MAPPANYTKLKLPLDPTSMYWPGPKKVKLPQSFTPLAQLTKEEWEGMDPKARWDSIVALRGPDLRNSDTLKFLTTSVIRHRLSGVMRVGGMVNRDLPFVVCPPGYVKDLGQFSLTHFLGHIREAAMWLNIPICNPDPESWALTVGSRPVVEVLAKLYAGLDAGPFKDAIQLYLYKGGFGPDPASLLKKIAQSGEEAPDAPGGAF